MPMEWSPLIYIKPTNSEHCLIDKKLVSLSPKTVNTNHVDYTEHLLPAAKRTLALSDRPKDLFNSLLSDEPKINPDFRPYLRSGSRFPAASFVQLCWALAASKSVTEDVWTESVFARLESIGFDGNAVFSIQPWHRQAMVIQRNRTYDNKVDMFHYSLLVNVLALVSASKMSAETAVSRGAKKVLELAETDRLKMDSYRYPVSADFAAAVTAALAAKGRTPLLKQRDALGNVIDVLVKEKVALVLLDKEDYVYLTPGYEAVKGLSDLQGSMKVKMAAMELQGYTVHPVSRGDWENWTQKDRKGHIQKWLG